MQLAAKWSRRLCIMMLLLLLTQCGREATPAPVAAEPVELTLISFDIGNAWTAAEDYTFIQFQTREPNITFTRQSFNQPPQQYLTLSPPPDMMTSGAYSFLTQAIEQNLVLDLTELWAETGLRDAFPAGFQQLSAYEGKQYYLPVAYAWSAIYYNRALFNQYGLQPPQSWDEFMAICDTLLANGETPLVLAGQETWLSMLWFDYLDLRLNGAAFHRALLQGQIPYSDSRVLAVVEQWSQLLRNGYVVERPEGINALSSLLALVRDDQGLLNGQKAAMTLVGPFWMTDLPDKFHAELDFFRFPTMDPAVPAAEVVTTLGYMAPNSGAHLPATLAYLGYMGSKEGQTTMAQQLGKSTIWVPARNDLDPELLSSTLKQGTEIVRDVPDLVSPYMLTLPNEMWPLIDRAFARFLREPDQIDEFINKLEEARQQAVEEGWLRAS